MFMIQELSLQACTRLTCRSHSRRTSFMYNSISAAVLSLTVALPLLRLRLCTCVECCNL